MRQSKAPTETVESGMPGAREGNAMDAETLRRIVLYFVMAVVAVLAALEVTLARVGDPSAKQESPWISPLRDMDAALARGDFSAATTARHKADLAVLASPCWEGFLAVGDGALRLGEAGQERRAMEPEARRAYLSAMVRARNARSLEGAFRITEAFARLGDRDMVEQGVRIARELAGRDEMAKARVDEFVRRWAGAERSSNVAVQ